MGKIDLALALTCEEHRERLNNDPSAAGAPPLKIMVKFRGAIEPLQELGLVAPTVARHATEDSWIATGTIPAENLETLAALPGVVAIEGSRPLRPMLDRHVPAVHIDDVHGTGLTGKGVIVGVIEPLGFDFRHQNLRQDSDPKKTRILFLWDQGLGAIAPEHGPAEINPTFGVEYDSAHIERALLLETEDDPRGPFGEDADLSKIGQVVRSPDVSPDAHGTFVAAIAAGDGSQGDGCGDPGKFKGAAPEADLILVRLPTISRDPDEFHHLADSNDMVHAVDYIFKKAAKEPKKPAVINISLGDPLGPHDGSTLLEQQIDAFLQGQTGRAVVAAAGNEANKQAHASGTVNVNGTEELEIVVAPGNARKEQIEIYYRVSATTTGALDVSILPPELGTTVGPVSPGNSLNQGIETNRVVKIRTEPGKILVRLVVEAKTTQLPGVWKVRLSNSGSAPVNFDCFLSVLVSPQVAPVSGLTFTGATAASADTTITAPASGRNVIAVGCSSVAKDEIYKASSLGPPRDAANRFKPDVVAPGVGLTSATANSKDPDVITIWGRCSDCCIDFYRTHVGTSASAPLVAGLVALMFQKNPNLTTQKVLEIFRTTANNDSPPGPAAPNNTWGYGIVNAQKAIAAVPAATGGGGGGGAVLDAASPPVPIWSTDRDWYPARVSSILSGLVRRQILRGITGQLGASVVSRHFSEVRGLINHNRRLATLWHRLRGPDLGRELLDAVAANDLEQRFAPFDEARLRHARRFMTLLSRYGSASLQKSISEFGGRVLGFLEAPPAAPGDASDRAPWGAQMRA
jgi:subtilisin family serine protease